MDVLAASTLSIAGPQFLNWTNFGQFINDGTFQIGSATASGGLMFSMFDQERGKPGSITNTGSMVLQNNSRFTTEIQGEVNNVFLNAAGAVLSINSGSFFDSPGPSTVGYDFLGTSVYHLRIANNGLIAVNGAAGRTTRLYSEGNYSGSGLLSVRGAPGAALGDTSARIRYNGASGIFDIASGELDYAKFSSAGSTPLGGAVNFLDNNGTLIAYDAAASSGGTVVSATITGFQAGDRIVLRGSDRASSYTYDPATHKLTLKMATSSGSPAASVEFTLAGNYAESDFKVTPAQFGNDGTGSDNVITTTSTANAVPPFSYQDTTTQAAGIDPGQQYTGPVNYLQSQYIWVKPDSVNLVTHMPNTFLQGNAGNDALVANSGSNVLDGGFGSNFITGASGADGGRDTFFLDGSAGTTGDTIVNFHPGDSAILWGFVPGTSAFTWAGNEGAAGHTGATIHAAFAGAGAAINGSLTFAGLSLADAQGKLSLTPGSVGGRSYLYVHYNG